MSSFLVRAAVMAAGQPSGPLTARDDPNSAANSPEGAAVISPLPSLQRNGLIVVATLGLLSLLSTVSLLAFFTYRFIFWKRYYKRYIGYNQYVVLMINLIAADFIQALGFIVSLRWIAMDSLHASDPSCFLQGIWLQVGDPMSGMFVLSIAIHTYLHVSKSYHIPHRTFIAAIFGLWTFGILLAIIPVATYGRYVWYPAVAWCWMTLEYKQMRLWTHYFWIFAAQFFTVVIYAILFVQLRRKMKESAILGSSHLESLHRMKRVVTYMLTYPIVYTVLSLPLAAGRMASAHGNTPSVLYFCFAGSIMACSGICDTLMYTLTRRSIVLESEERITTSNNNNNKYHQSEQGRMYHNSTAHHAGASFLATIDEDKGAKAVISSIAHGDAFARNRSESTDAIIRGGAGEFELLSSSSVQVYQHTTIEVTHEPAYEAADFDDDEREVALPPRRSASRPVRR